MKARGIDQANVKKEQVTISTAIDLLAILQQRLNRMTFSKFYRIFERAHNSDWSSNASQSNLVYKIVYKNVAQSRLFFRIAKRSIVGSNNKWDACDDASVK